MGSGKSSLGKALAKQISVPFQDLDHYIVSKEGKSIPEIFTQKGEIYFRKIESNYLKELLDNPNSIVLALGGGTPCYANNMQLILNHPKTLSFYLKLNYLTLSNRLWYEKEQRPLIASSTSKEELEDYIRKHLFERQFFYLKANHTIDVEEKDIPTLTNELTNLLKDNQQ